MRRSAICLIFFLLIGGASACSGPHVQEVIHKNLRSAQISLGLLVAITLVSLAVSIASRRFLWPITLAVTAIAVWSQLGTVNSGDCGTTAVMSGEVGVVLGLAGLTWQTTVERLIAQKRQSAT